MRVHVAAITRDELEWPVDRLPATPSYELSGVIAALGPGADGVAVGDEVTTTRTAPGQPRVVVASSGDRQELAQAHDGTLTLTPPLAGSASRCNNRRATPYNQIVPKEEQMSATKTSQSKRFTAEEKAAMKERAKELKAEKSRAEGEQDLLAKIAEMKGSDRTLAKRVHEIVKAAAPDLVPRTWYGMPAYRNEDDKVVCFFKNAGKFKSRYATLGFNDAANLDAGNMWPTEFALKKLTPAEEKKVSALVKKAVS